VGALDRFRAQWRGIEQRREAHCRAQIREAAERLAQFEQTFFRSQLRREVIESRTTYRAEKHCIGSETGLERIVRQGMVARSEARTAHGLSRDLDFVAENTGNGTQNAKGFFRNFRADAVAGEDGNF